MSAFEAGYSFGERNPRFLHHFFGNRAAVYIPEGHAQHRSGVAVYEVGVQPLITRPQCSDERSLAFHGPRHRGLMLSAQR